MKLLYIDLFCGAGGTSTGVESARHNGEKCAKVIGCVNHTAKALCEALVIRLYELNLSPRIAA